MFVFNSNYIAADNGFSLFLKFSSGCWTSYFIRTLLYPTPLSWTFTVSLGTSWEVSLLDLDTPCSSNVSVNGRLKSFEDIEMYTLSTWGMPPPASTSWNGWSPNSTATQTYCSILSLNTTKPEKLSTVMAILTFKQTYMQGKCISFEDIEMYTLCCNLLMPPRPPEWSPHSTKTLPLALSQVWSWQKLRNCQPL